MTETHPGVIDVEARAELRSLSREVQSIAETMQQAFEHTDRQITRLIEVQNTMGRANYPLLISAVTLVAFIGTLLAAPFAFNVARVDGNVTKVTEALATHISDGHPRRIDERLDALRERLDEYAKTNREIVELRDELQDSQHGELMRRVTQLERQRNQQSEDALTFLNGKAWSAITKRD